MLRKALYIVLICIQISVTAYLIADNSDENKLYKITQQGKYGFINKTGNIIIQPIFKYADDFFENLCNVKYNDKYGIINKTGVFVVEPNYDFIDSFAEERAAVKKNRKWGFINKDGKRVIDFLYKNNYYFSEGLAAVIKYNESFGSSAEDLMGFIDKTGTLVIPFKYKEYGIDVTPLGGKPTYGFHDGLVYVYDEKTEKYGYIDKTDNFAIKPQFDKCNSFKNGYAVVGLYFGSETSDNYREGIIDKNGNWVIKPVYYKVFPFEKSGDTLFAKVNSSKENKYGYVNCKGEPVIKAKYSSMGTFSEGLVAVSNNNAIEFKKNNKVMCGYIDISDKLVIEPQFEDAYSFSQGLAACAITVNNELKYGYIDKKGQWVINPQFDWAYEFDENGIAMVKMGDDEYYAAIGYINRKGEYIWKPSK